MSCTEPSIPKNTKTLKITVRSSVWFHNFMSQPPNLRFETDLDFSVIVSKQLAALCGFYSCKQLGWVAACKCQCVHIRTECIPIQYLAASYDCKGWEWGAGGVMFNPSSLETQWQTKTLGGVGGSLLQSHPDSSLLSKCYSRQMWTF